MADDTPLTRLGATLEGVLFGERAGLYRTFLRATFVVTLGLVSAYAVAVSGVLGLGSGVTTLLGTATMLAVAILVITGIAQFVVLGRVYQRGTSDVAQTAAELERAADHLEDTAEELEATAEEVEEAAETVDEAADEVEQTAAQVDDTGNGESVEAVTQKASQAKEKTDDAKSSVDAATDEAEEAKKTAEAVEAIAAEKRERIPGAVDADSGAETEDRE